jgi:hypothetical protein
VINTSVYTEFISLVTCEYIFFSKYVSRETDFLTHHIGMMSLLQYKVISDKEFAPWFSNHVFIFNLVIVTKQLWPSCLCRSSNLLLQQILKTLLVCANNKRSVQQVRTPFLNSFDDGQHLFLIGGQCQGWPF